MKITFPLKSAHDFDTDCVAFPVLIDDKESRCLISQEALQDHFGAREGDWLVEVFEANRPRIELAAQAKIQAGAVGTDILVRSGDL